MVCSRTWQVLQTMIWSKCLHIKMKTDLEVQYEGASCMCWNGFIIARVVYRLLFEILQMFKL